MKLDDLLGQLLPLFEKKMTFTMAMKERELSLQEKSEERKTDLEYRKLEAQITNDKDKLAWEKEKLSTAIKGEVDLQALKNTGLLDAERLRGLNDKEKQEIIEAGAMSRANLSSQAEGKKANAEIYKANMDFLAKTGIVETGVNPETGATYTKKSGPDNLGIRKNLEQQLFPTDPQPVIPAGGGNNPIDATTAINTIKQYEAAGANDAARNFLGSLPANVRAEVDKVIAPPAGGSTPAGAAPVTPLAQSVAGTGRGTIVPRLQEDNSLALQATSTPSRPAIPTTPAPGATGQFTSPSAPAAGTRQPLIPPTASRLYPWLPTSMVPDQQPPAAAQAGRSPATPFSFPAPPQQQAEEEKRRALQKARGLSVGTF